jgi:hypothetical protein
VNRWIAPACGEEQQAEGQDQEASSGWSSFTMAALRVRMERFRAAFTTIAFCLAVLSPLVPGSDGRPRDGFPLSWYPMFRGTRPARETVLWVRAELANGTTRPVATGWWTPGGLTEGRAHLERAVKTGAQGRFCQDLAAQFGERTRGWASEVVALAVVRSTWTLAAYFTAPEPRPESERVLHRCEVPR